jgi:penicillin-binding protein 1C
MEFGRNSVWNFSEPAAVKTGTSSDYRDAWALGFNDKFTVGVWMGNLDYTEMREVTGSSGPALVLRSVFTELNGNRDVRPLFLSPQLI